MTTAIATATSTDLAKYIASARDAVKAYKASLCIDMLIGDGDHDCLRKARVALGALREYGETNPGTRTALDTGEGRISVNGIDAWEAIVSGCGIKGGTAHVRKGKMANVKAAGKAIMSVK
tara:strand:- start:24959 stop:25318 length:360 start_codon:yes stop_codon:yes gene_type:complete